ncbi:MAG TPA: UDP-3-O-(3-hydroxymyristoyl)glucosamine N-acyltransferase, partial [Burkholderiales bacterium]|nr:UDP-3-O-(3-hydroxymyristoyl)glucosamine N-acyltransferase [Burkholderiales bacterium]
MPSGKDRGLSLGSIVKRLGGELIGDKNIIINQVAPLDSAGPGHLSFLSQSKYIAQLKKTRADAVIIGHDARNLTRLARIVCDDPYAYFAKVSALLNPAKTPVAGIHPSAVITKSAQVPASATIGAHACIGENVVLGERVVVGEACVVGEGVTLGEKSFLHPRVVIYHDCVIGEKVILHSGTVIGADGFGMAMEEGRWLKIPQIGRVVIGDDVEIGANTTIDRGSLADTHISSGVKLDNLVHVGHNCQIGEHSVVA